MTVPALAAPCTASGQTLEKIRPSQLFFQAGLAEKQHSQLELPRRMGEAERILSTDDTKFLSSWSANGRFLLFFSANPATGVDNWILPMTGDRKPSVLLKTPFFEVWPRFSPHGKWVA
ncbi:MAG: hypothetical protein ABI645_12390 [Pseudomonadota bacterium]